MNLHVFYGKHPADIKTIFPDQLSLLFQPWKAPLSEARLKWLFSVLVIIVAEKRRDLLSRSGRRRLFAAISLLGYPF